MSPPTGAPIRIVHCIGSMRVGGAEKQLAELIRRLPRDRFRQSLVLLQEEGPLVRDVKEAGCEVFDLDHRIGIRKFDPRFSLNLSRVVRRFAAFLRRERPDILHAQLYWANVLSVAAGRFAGVPVILTSRLQLSDYKAGRPLLQHLENLTNRYTTAVFANSEAVRRDALAHERLDPAKVRVIYNGVAVERFGPGSPAAARAPELRRELRLTEDDLVLISVANLHPYKGHEDLLRAVASLLPRHPNLKLLLPGRDQGARPGIETMIADLGLQNVVRLLGERTDVPELLSLSDIFIHPSHQEGFSNSILEAMASAKPVVVTRVGGNPEAITDGVHGLIVPPRDPAALSAALERLLLDPGLRRSMGERGRERIHADFTFDAMTCQFIGWYEQLVRESHD